jgi:hypothetical protein
MLTSVVAGTWSSEGVWSTLEDSVNVEGATQTFVIGRHGEAVARELMNGKVIKFNGTMPPDANKVQYSDRAFRYWTVDDAYAFERGEAVDPWLPKSNMTNRGN